MKKWHWNAVLLAALIIMISAGFCLWLSTTTYGLKWLGSALSQLSRGTVLLEGLDGTLSGPIRVNSLRFASDDLLLVARDIRLRWQPQALLSGRLEITELAVTDVEVVSPPSSDPATLPESLELPLPVSLRKLDIGSIRVLPEKGAPPDFAATEITARLESDGNIHDLADLRMSLEFGELAASGRIEGDRPFDLSARAKLMGLAISDVPGAPPAHISAHIAGNLEQITVRVEGSGAGLTGEGAGQLRPYAPLVVAGLRLSVDGLNPRAFSLGAPSASLSLQADLSENSAGQLEGSLIGHNHASKPLDQGGLPLLELRAQAVLSEKSLRLDELKVVMPGGGSLSGNVAWLPAQETASADLLVDRINPMSLDTRLRPASINGTMKLSGDAEQQQGVLALKDQKLQMDVVFARTDDTLIVEKVHLRHGRSALTGQGKLGLNNQHSFSFEGRLHHFDVSAFVQAPRTDLNATLKLAGTLGSRSEPVGTVRFRMADSQIADHAVTGSGQVEFAGASLLNGRASGEIKLQLGDNHLAARGGFGHKGDKLHLDLAAPALAQFGYGLGGSVNAQAVLETGLAGFGQAALVLPDLSFRVEGERVAFPGDHNLAAFAADGTLRDNALALKISLSDYGTKTTTRLQSFQLEVTGGVSRHHVSAAARLEGNQTLVLKATGGLENASGQWQSRQDLQWLGELSELSASGQFPFRLTAAAPVKAGLEYASLGAAKLAIAGGELQIEELNWSPQRWSSSGHFTGIALRGGDADKGAWKNHDPLRLGGKWDIASAAQLRGMLRVARESGDWILPGDPPFSLGLQTLEFRAGAADGRVTGELKARGMRLGVASANIALPIVRSEDAILNWTVLPRSGLDGHISLNMEDISWVGTAFDNSDNLRMGGQLALEADLIGTLGAPSLSGQIRGDDLALALLDQGVQLEQGKLAARFDQESLHLDILDFTAPHQPPPNYLLLKRHLSEDSRGQFVSGIMSLIEGRSEDRPDKNLELPKGPGSLRASGTMNLAGERGDLEITASLLPLAQRPDRWVIASGTGRVTLEKNVLTLSGDLVADAGLIAQPDAGSPQLPDDVIIIGEDASGQQKADRQGLRIDVEATLDLGQQFYIRASGLEGRLVGQLRVHGEPGQQLRAIGTIAARNANFEAYGQRLAVERGIVNFQGPIDDPGMNVLAVRKGLPVQAGVEVTGSVRQPKVRLVSTPDVPDLEKLSWIALGRAPGGRADTSLLLAAAGAILGGQSGSVTEKISVALGVDELSIRQSGTDPLTGQVGVVGKRLSDRAYISYEQGLMAMTGVTKLTYNLTPKITVITRAGMDNAIDVLYTLRFD